jgi:hypothetical protein
MLQRIHPRGSVQDDGQLHRFQRHAGSPVHIEETGQRLDPSVDHRRVFFANPDVKDGLVLVICRRLELDDRHVIHGAEAVDNRTRRRLAKSLARG